MNTRAIQAMLWMVGCTIGFSLLNGLTRVSSFQLPAFQVQFMRYIAAVAVLLPIMAWQGFGNFRPSTIKGQFWRGAVHTSGLLCFFLAMPHVPLAEMTALNFAWPVFVMVGAVLFLKEPMVPARWIATGLGFLGVLVVVAPQLSGSGGGGLWTLVMLCSAPLFAWSFIITKTMTRKDSASVIVVWQSLTVALCTLPFALAVWQPVSWDQVLWFLMLGVLGAGGHFCLVRAFSMADVSVTQPIKFLDLIWASILGWLLFGDVPGPWTFAGAFIIFASTTWIARREARA